MAKSWSIIGAGPVGSMQAVLLATVFPGQKLDILDQRPVHQRNHGLQIRNATIDDINSQLEQIEAQIKEFDDSDSIYNQLVLENIKKTKKFLETSFKSFTGGQFIRTKNISNKLQKFAEELAQNNVKILHEGSVQFHMGETYKIGEAQLNKLKAPREDAENSNLSEAEQILWDSNLIFGADGSHSQVRKHIFNDPEPEKDVIQHLLEIKLDIKTKSRESSSFASSEKSMEFVDASTDLVSRSILPTLKRGKLHVWTVGNEGTATLHILVDKQIYDTLLSKSNAKGNMGMPGNPYTRLRQVPIENGVRSLITIAIRDTIGLNKIEPESIKITTIPMHVYSAKLLMITIGGRTFILSGDSGMGLIFIRGVNHGLQSAMAYVSALFQLLHNRKSVKDIAEYEFPEEIPQELKDGEAKLKAMYEKKVHEIKGEQSKIDLAIKAIETTHKISYTSSKLVSSISEEENESDQLRSEIELRALLQDLDSELNNIEIVLDEKGDDLHANKKAFRAWLPALDLLANEFDKGILQLEKAPKVLEQEKEYLREALRVTIDLVKRVTATQDKNTQRVVIQEFKTYVAQLSKMGEYDSTLSGFMSNTIRSMLDYFLPSLSNSIFASNVETAAYAVIDAGFRI